MRSFISKESVQTKCEIENWMDAKSDGVRAYGWACGSESSEIALDEGGQGRETTGVDRGHGWPKREMGGRERSEIEIEQQQQQRKE